MTKWLLKRIITADVNTSFWALARHLTDVVFLALGTDKMPVVEVTLAEQEYILLRKKDFEERFGE